MRRLAAVALFLCLAFVFAVAQHSALYRWAFLGSQPDLLTLLALGVSCRSRPAAGAAAGFVCGTLRGLSAGAGLAPTTVSLTLIGFAIGLLGRAELRLTSLAVGALVAVGTVAVRLTTLLAAPPPDIPHYLTATIGTAIMNGVVAAPLDAVWKRLIGEAVD
jgi:cell shape-determining protein MreD